MPYEWATWPAEKRLGVGFGHCGLITPLWWQLRNIPLFHGFVWDVLGWAVITRQVARSACYGPRISAFDHKCLTSLHFKPYMRAQSQISMNFLFKLYDLS